MRYNVKVNCVPSFRIGIIDYLSRDQTFKAPMAEDESQLIIAKIKELSILKNLNYLEIASNLLTTNATRSTEQKKS